MNLSKAHTCQAAFVKEAISAGVLRRAMANRQKNILLQQAKGLYTKELALRNQDQFNRVLAKVMNRKTLPDGRMIPINAGNPGLTQQLLRAAKDEKGIYRTGDGFTVGIGSTAKSPWEYHIGSLFHTSAPNLSSSSIVQQLPRGSKNMGLWRDRVLSDLPVTGDLQRFKDDTGYLAKFLTERIPGLKRPKDPMYFRMRNAMHSYQQAAPAGSHITTYPGNPHVEALYNRLGWAGSGKHESDMIIKPNLDVPFAVEALKLNRATYGKLPKAYQDGDYTRQLGKYLSNEARAADNKRVINRFFNANVHGGDVAEAKRLLRPPSASKKPHIRPLSA